MSSEEDINADNSPDSPGNPKDNALFEPKPKPKVIRVLTVLAYILSVSMAAILLSIYYIFMWNEQKTYTAPHNEVAPSASDVSFSLSVASPVISVASSSYTMEEDNVTSSESDYVTQGLPQREMQQQITGAGENEVLATSSSTADDNTTSPQYGFSLDNEFGKTSTFIKKLMHKYPYAEND
ncbi:hypothetical protein MTP99_001238 [Tenebrio molitor]|jgi:hypothetical protein|nr:hypothetical protein MTP99_001238 [Tenebrio molitor]